MTLCIVRHKNSHDIIEFSTIGSKKNLCGEINVKVLFLFFFFLKIASPDFSFSNHGQTTFRFKFDVHLNLTANVGLETAAAGYEKPECCD